MTVCGYSEKKRKHIVKLFCTQYNNKSIIFQPMFISRLSVNTLSITLSLVAILCPYSTHRKYSRPETGEINVVFIPKLLPYQRKHVGFLISWGKIFVTYRHFRHFPPTFVHR